MITGETVLERLNDQLADGTIIGARGPNGPFAPNSPLNNWFKSEYFEQYNSSPVYSSYHMATAILGTKAAWEKAQGNQYDKTPDIEDVINAFRISRIRIRVRSCGNESRQRSSSGTTCSLWHSKKINGKVTLVNIKYYEPNLISPGWDEKS